MYQDTDGKSQSHFWWRNHVDRRFYTILAFDTEGKCQGWSVMDDFGDLVLVSK